MEGLRLLLYFLDHAPDNHIYHNNLHSVLERQPIELEDDKRCESNGCSFRHKTQFINTEEARHRYLQHARSLHHKDVVHCQYRRLVNGEIPLPEGILLNLYLLRLMMFICDKKMTCSSCIVPNCQRVGADRNIISGHYRETHPKTFFYCQLLTKEYDREAIQVGIERLSSVENKKKRKYNYKGASSEKEKKMCCLYK